MNIFFQCATQYDNLGDLVINKLLIDELCIHGTVYVDVYNVPDKFKKHLLLNKNAVDIYCNYGISSKRGLKSAFKAALFCYKHKVKLYCGSPGPHSLTNEIPSISKLRLRLHALLFWMAGVRVVSIGSCCSSLIYSGKILYNYGVKHYFLRSFESVHYANECGYVATYMPDLCYLLKVPKKEKQRVAVFDIRLVAGKDEDTKKWCKDLSKQLLEQGYDVQLYYQVERDLQPMKDLLAYIDNPLVTLHNKLIWYDDLPFYSDKMFVVSNRLHSLLIGAAFGACPICLYQESEATLKLKHVFKSSISNYKSLFPQPNDQLLFDAIYQKMSLVIQKDFFANMKLCKKIISSILNE